MSTECIEVGRRIRRRETSSGGYQPQPAPPLLEPAEGGRPPLQDDEGLPPAKGEGTPPILLRYNLQGTRGGGEREPPHRRMHRALSKLDPHPRRHRGQFRAAERRAYPSQEVR